MTNRPAHYFWDSCVFIRFLLKDQSADYFWDINQYISDAVAGKCQIHYSTIAMAEIKPSHLTASGYGDFVDFLADFEGAFSPIDPLPSVLEWCGVIRDFSYPNPEPKGHDRMLGMADAIHLMTCIFARDELGLQDIVFHTMDDGKHKNAEGKCVTLLNFEKWVEGIPKNPYTPRIVALPRKPPIHPAPRFDI
ncbi:type II toxin-antitoxin system VapC family toxin [Mesorhizobium sp. M0999]|uniref:type II toxin-antitoxin system VapC family toxin n=1 Tax=Mesorhizobium sp. M0999 TaxID=2957045 RepID=UPI00333D0004